MDNCGLTSDTLRWLPGSDAYSRFSGGYGTSLRTLSMRNSDYDASGASYNRFVLLDSNWLVTMEGIEVVRLGDVESVMPMFFSHMPAGVSVMTNTQTQPLQLQITLADGVAPAEQTGVLWNILSGYELLSPTNRIEFSLELRGKNLVLGTPLVPGVHASNDLLFPQSLSLPLEPAFLQTNLLQHYAELKNLTFTTPFDLQAENIASRLGMDYIVPWSLLLSDAAVPTDLLAEAAGLEHFAIELRTDGVPRSPVHTLPPELFQPVVPSTGFGALVTIDLSTAQLDSYDSKLFAGLSRPNTRLDLDMGMLYLGITPVPVGLFDDVPASGTVGFGLQSLSLTSLANHNRKCPAISNQACIDCSDGSWSTAVSTFHYCAQCMAGSSCRRGVLKPCGAGTFQPERGSLNCTQCATGTYSNSIGQSQPFTCIGCSPGRYQPLLGADSATACLSCAPGRASVYAGSSACDLCTAGTYASPKRWSCLQCPIGKYRESVYVNTSDVSRGDSIADCVSCPAGTTTTTAGADRGDLCTNVVCGTGYAFNLSRADALRNNNASMAVSLLSSYFCDKCPAGYACQQNVQTVCPAGTFAAAGGSSCSSCAPGRYRNEIAGSSIDDCLYCGPATFASRSGAASCQSCPPHTYQPASGSSSAADCLPCAGGGVLSSPSSDNSTAAATLAICPRGASRNISIEALSPDAASFIARSLHDDESASVGGTAYAPVRGGKSLRLTVDPDDATLHLSDALGEARDSSSSAHSGFDPTQAAVVSDTMLALMLSLCLACLIPLLCFRLLPLRAAKRIDLMSTCHSLESGGILVSRPTQFGASVSLSFVLVSIAVAIQLGTASNATLSSTLQPASANDHTGTAQGAWQVTIKAHGAPESGAGALSLDQWCMGSKPLRGNSGFTSHTGTAPMGARTTIQDGACVIAVDCLDCSVSSVGSVSISVPYVVQLVEWELWISGATPKSWSRMYGALTQVNGAMLDAESNLRFSVMESYYIDERAASSITYCQSHFASKDLLL
jgi:hypothetical protein